VCDIPNRVIARRLQISRRTVDYRRSQILTKLQAGNLKSLIWRLGAAGWPIAAERGLKSGAL
jgi:FixJ family two-component response regulator